MSAGAPSGSSRAGLYAALALAAAVLIGVVGGFALGRTARAPSEANLKRAVLSDMTMLGVSRAALMDTLRLAPSQRVEIDSLLDDARSRAESATTGFMEGVRAITTEARERVRSALDDGQRARFDSLMSATPPLRPRTPVPPRNP